MSAGLPEDDLAAILDRAWALLARGVADRRAALRILAFGTVAPDGAPELRNVVLRGSDRSAGLLEVHTDLRSAKVAAIRGEPRVALTGWDPRLKLQLRLSGRAIVESGAGRGAEIWAGLSEGARQAYPAGISPGQRIASPEVLDGEAEPDGSQFAVMSVSVESLEWLHLRDGGHRRARFDRGDGWQGCWLAP